MDARNQSGDIHPFIECLRDKIITPDRLCAIQYKSLFQNLEIRCDNEHLYNFGTRSLISMSQDGAVENTATSS